MESLIIKNIQKYQEKREDFYEKSHPIVTITMGAIEYFLGIGIGLYIIFNIYFYAGEIMPWYIWGLIMVLAVVGLFIILRIKSSIETRKSDKKLILEYDNFRETLDKLNQQKEDIYNDFIERNSGGENRIKELQLIVDNFNNYGQKSTRKIETDKWELDAQLNHMMTERIDRKDNISKIDIEISKLNRIIKYIENIKNKQAGVTVHGKNKAA